MALTQAVLPQNQEKWGLKRNLEWLRNQMETERNSFVDQWQDCNDFILPRRARFFVTDKNRGERRNLKIKDTTPSLAARTLRAGMMAGITSPARPWFRLAHDNPELMEAEGVKAWLHESTERMRGVFLRTNLYKALTTVYGDIGVFGTGGILMEEDPDKLIHFECLPIGSYMIANNEYGRVNVMIREFQMSVRQIVDKFGRVNPDNPEEIDWSRITTSTKNLWDSGNPQADIRVVHCIRPNPDYNPNLLASKYKRFSSVYYELGVSNTAGGTGLGGGGGHVEENRILRIGGFDNFMGLFPRWEVTGEDDYGSECPGFTAIGDIKQLQYGESLSLQGIEATVKPPMLAPTALKNNDATTVPGGITYVDMREGLTGFQPAYQLDFNVERMERKQEQVRMRTSRAFYEDLFLMLANDDRSQRATAREIEERHQEKLLALGPVLEQLNQDLLDPLIDNTFMMMDRAGMIPEPPPALEGQEIKVEYISIMAQAQRAMGLGAINDLSNFVAKEMAVDPSAGDGLDRDEMIRTYAELTSSPPDLILSKEALEQKRAQRAEMEQKAMANEQMNIAADSAQKLGNTPVGGEQETALDALTGGLGDVPL